MRGYDMRSHIWITILTPTYNRAYTLPRLYKSLCRQSCKDFMWLIVDDGSVDDTKDVVSSFKADFPLHYIYKENGGKHTALNTGMKYITTDYTFIVDSDDYLRDNAIESANRWIDDISGISGFAGVAGVTGIAGLKCDEENKVIGQFPKNYKYIDCLNSERKQHKLLGDKAEIYKTELLKTHPFPVYDDERFMPESIIWNQFSLEGYKVRWYKECIKVCEYLSDGLTSATRCKNHFKENYKGYRDDCALNLKVLRFPYNYSSASVFYARCCDIKKTKRCLASFELSFLERVIIILVGRCRYYLERY